jgi:hypothetical protein
MAAVRLRVLVFVVSALLLAACTSAQSVARTTQVGLTPTALPITTLSPSTSLGTGSHGTLLIETSACAGAITDGMLRHPPHVQLSLRRLDGGAVSYRVLAWRRYRASVPAGRYRVSQAGVATRPVLTTVQLGRTINVAIPLNCF